MKNNQNGFPVLLAVIITVAIALAGGYIYLLNKNSLKSYYTDQGIIAVRGNLTGDENCNFTLDNEIEAGENNYAHSLRIPEFNKRCEEMKKYSGQRVEIKGHVFGESFSEPCACLPEGYIEKIESIYALPSQKTAESPISVIDTSNWQTYLNDEWGIEIKYPDSWIIQGNEVHDQNSGAYLAISLLANPQNLSFADWWEKNMIVGGRPAVLYNSENMEASGLKAKIAYMPEGEGGWHIHIADEKNRIFSLLAKGPEAGNQVFDRMLSTFQFINQKGGQSDTAGWQDYQNEKYGIEMRIPPLFGSLGYKIAVEKPSWDEEGCIVLQVSLKAAPGSVGYKKNPLKYENIVPLLICDKNIYCKKNDCVKFRQCAKTVDPAPGCDNFIFMKFIGENTDHLFYTQGGSAGGDVYDYNGWDSDQFSKNSKEMFESVKMYY